MKIKLLSFFSFLCFALAAHSQVPTIHLLKNGSLLSLTENPSQINPVERNSNTNSISSISLKDSDYTWHRNNNLWNKVNKNIYTYDINNNETVVLNKTWNGTSWINNSKDNVTYNVNNFATNALLQNWNGSAWV